MPTISVIVPVYNVEPYLRRCVDSILNQTFSDFELILVDDGSPDNCGAICDEYAARDKRIKVIHKTNGGISDARNAGLEIAQGDYIGFVDSDDYIHPKMYEILVEVMEREKTDLVQCWYQRVHPDETMTFFSVEKIPDVRSYDCTTVFDQYYPYFAKKVPGYVCIKLYRKKLFDNLRFPTGLVLEDLHVLFPILDKCESIALVDMPLYYYVQSPDSILRGSVTLKRVHDHMSVYDKHLTFFESRGNIAQYRLTQEAMCSVFALYYFNHHFIKPIECYMEEWKKVLKHYPSVLLSRETCNMKKVCLLSMLVNKHLAIRLFFKYYPEYVPQQMWNVLKNAN